MFCFVLDNANGNSNGNNVEFRIKNNCRYKIWPGFYGKSKSNPNCPLPFNGGWELGSGQTTSFDVPKDLFAVRMWARTNCRNEGNQFICDTGRCRPSVQCSGSTGEPPVTLAEFTLNGAGKKDYYDVSLVDGYNLKMNIRPLSPNSDEHTAYWCKNVGCNTDLNSICPQVLKKFDKGGKVISCMSACTKFNTPQYCCAGQFGKPETCKPTQWPTNYAAVFKRACQAAYSYAYDDTTSSFFCRKTGYEISFC